MAWCPEAFEPASQATIRSLDFVDLIEVPSAGSCGRQRLQPGIIWLPRGYERRSAGAQAAIENAGLAVTTLSNTELAKTVAVCAAAV